MFSSLFSGDAADSKDRSADQPSPVSSSAKLSKGVKKFSSWLMSGNSDTNSLPKDKDGGNSDGALEKAKPMSQTLSKAAKAAKAAWKEYNTQGNPVNQGSSSLGSAPARSNMFPQGGVSEDSPVASEGGVSNTAGSVLSSEPGDIIVDDDSQNAADRLNPDTDDTEANDEDDNVDEEDQREVQDDISSWQAAEAPDSGMTRGSHEPHHVAFVASPSPEPARGDSFSANNLRPDDAEEQNSPLESHQPGTDIREPESHHGQEHDAAYIIDLPPRMPSKTDFHSTPVKPAKPTPVGTSINSTPPNPATISPSAQASHPGQSTSSVILSALKSMPKNMPKVEEIIFGDETNKGSVKAVPKVDDILFPDDASRAHHASVPADADSTYIPSSSDGVDGEPEVAGRGNTGLKFMSMLKSKAADKKNSLMKALSNAAHPSSGVVGSAPQHRGSMIGGSAKSNSSSEHDQHT
jgi:hypothetical protein